MISAIVLTKNEEKNIIECLETLKWCDEIIIVDDYSQDNTLKEVESLNSKLKVFQRHLDENFAQQRNFGLEKARGEWVLFVDADERVSSALAEEIQFQISNGRDCAKGEQSLLPTNVGIKSQMYNGFYIKRRDFLFGKWLEHGETGNIKLLRLAKKGAGPARNASQSDAGGKWERPIHETWQINEKVGELESPLLHYPHQTIREFLDDINFYTDLNAQVFYKEGVKVSFWQILAYPSGKFIKNYFLSLGFLDGIAGLLHATFMSFHSFLTRAKLWLLWQKN